MGKYFSDDLLDSLGLLDEKRNPVGSGRKKKYVRKLKVKRTTNWDMLFPNYPVSEKEDLNLERMYVVYLKLYWGDTETYPTLIHLSKKMNLKPKYISSLSRKYKLGARS